MIWQFFRIVWILNCLIVQFDKRYYFPSECISKVFCTFAALWFVQKIALFFISDSEWWLFNPLSAGIGFSEELCYWPFPPSVLPPKKWGCTRLNKTLLRRSLGLIFPPDWIKLFLINCLCIILLKKSVFTLKKWGRTILNKHFPQRVLVKYCLSVLPLKMGPYKIE